jgi:hypothetical protein
VTPPLNGMGVLFLVCHICNTVQPKEDEEGGEEGDMDPRLQLNMQVSRMRRSRTKAFYWLALEFLGCMLPFAENQRS